MVTTTPAIIAEEPSSDEPEDKEGWRSEKDSSQISNDFHTHVHVHVQIGYRYVEVLTGANWHTCNTFIHVHYSTISLTYMYMYK